MATLTAGTYLKPEHLCTQLGSVHDNSAAGTGGVALVDARYLIQLWESNEARKKGEEKKPFLRRDDLEAQFATKAELEKGWDENSNPLITKLDPNKIRYYDHEKAQFKKNEGEVVRDTIIVALSYGWITPGHPDPNCFTLDRLAPFLKKYIAYRNANDYYVEPVIENGKTTSPGKTFKEAEKTVRVAVFIDFCSLYQQKSKEIPREEPKQTLFVNAMKIINVWYAHQCTHTWAMSTLPAEEGVNPYNLRGWCNFEQLVSAFSQGPILDLGSLDLDSENLVHRYKEKKVAKDVVEEKKVVINDANFGEVLRNLHGKRRVPMVTEGFDTFLNERHGSVPLPTLVTGENLSAEDKEKNDKLEEADKVNWKIKITSGKDRQFLVTKYKETFDSMALSAHRFYFNDSSWGDNEVTLLSGILPACKKLQTLHIVGKAITVAGIKTLFKALAKSGFAGRIYLGSEDEVVVNFLTKNCKELKITVIKTDIVEEGYIPLPPADTPASVAEIVGYPGVPERKQELLQAKTQSFSGDLSGRSSGSFSFQRLASSLLEATDNMIGHSEQLEDDVAAKDAIIAAQEERIQDQNARIAALERQAARPTPARHATTRARTTVRNRNARAPSTGDNNHTDTGNEHYYC